VAAHALRILDAILRKRASQADPPFEIATLQQLAEFNHVSNLRGEQLRCLIASTDECSEGVSFVGVRRLLLAQVPPSYTALQQMLGRACRMDSHMKLLQHERNVDFNLFVATVPGERSADQRTLQLLLRQANIMVPAAEHLRSNSIPSGSILDLVLSQHWFDQILRGGKLSEFRAGQVAKQTDAPLSLYDVRVSS
jgi:hypothetical protein